ncbi:MAG: hypothetical protein DMG58_02490 [Acidobacteria bacterium]|nr:MAG: hypothetical protein DMG58_02490 [Acidobacteriota bacterium]
MSLQVFKEIRAAVANLDPAEVQAAADRPLRIGLLAASERGFAAMKEFLLPSEKVSERKRAEGAALLDRALGSEPPDHFDVVLCEQGLPCPRNGYTFFAGQPEETVCEVLAAHDELALALARNFPPFRQPVVDRVIHNVSKENALFSVVTALPDVVPSILELPWAIGEFASDTAFLTINQIRMAFLIAAASDKPVGYSLQKAEIATIMTGAFGWRALARELVGKIPFGGGLIPKGAIAFPGTYVVGLGLDRLHRLGYGLSSAERRDSYQVAFERGKGIVELVLRGIKSGNAA